MPVLTIGRHAVTLSVDELIEYERKLAVVQDDVALRAEPDASAATPERSEDVPPERAHSEQRAPTSTVWTSSTVQMLMTHLDEAQRAALTLLLSRQGPIDGTSIAEAASVKPRGIGSLMRGIRTRCAVLGMSAPFTSVMDPSRGASVFEATALFREAAKTLSNGAQPNL